MITISLLFNFNAPPIMTADRQINIDLISLIVFVKPTAYKRKKFINIHPVRIIRFLICVLERVSLKALIDNV